MLKLLFLLFYFYFYLPTVELNLQCCRRNTEKYLIFRMNTLAKLLPKKRKYILNITRRVLKVQVHIIRKVTMVLYISNPNFSNFIDNKSNLGTFALWFWGLNAALLCIRPTSLTRELADMKISLTLMALGKGKSVFLKSVVPSRLTML